MKHVVTIGGGGGHSQVLKALKCIPDVQITGICPSTDSGGSTGILQREYDGSGYTGDLTKCILALSNDETLKAGLSYRYEDGSLHTHSVKNLLFHALEKVSSTKEALLTMWRVCGLGPHRIMPVTTEKTELCAHLRMGSVIVGETNIDTIARNPLWNPDVHSISDIYLKPAVSVSKDAAAAIREADYLIICPGDLYSSILPALLPRGMEDAILRSSARIILILNIMTKLGETDNYTANDMLAHIERRMGRRADHILYNNEPIPDAVLLKYALERKVELETERGARDPRIIACPLAMISETDQIYSNPETIRQVVYDLIREE